MNFIFKLIFYSQIFRLNVFLNGSKLSSLQFHLTNVLLYTCLCLLSLPTYEMLIGKKRLKIFNTAFLASILFTVHPIHSEAVASLVGRADILSSILFFMALLLYKRFLKFKSLILFPLIAMVIFAAVLCKETAISVLVRIQAIFMFNPYFRIKVMIL